MRAFAVALTAAAVAFASADASARIYRWVDEDGNVHYSDQIPPDQIERGHTRITDTGIPVESVPAAKTAAERLREQELERLRIQQQQLIQQQAEADKILLRTYRSIDDILMAREGKLAGIDAMVGVARSHIRRQQEWLVELYSEAANLERAGKPVAKHLEDSIAKSEATIRDAYAGIIGQEQKKQEIRESFARDLMRYRLLAGLPEDAATSDALGPSSPTGPQDLLNLVSCAGKAECDALWRLAVAFVRREAMTPLQTAKDNLIVTAAPRGPNELGLILSRIQETDGGGSALFLDIQCQARRGDSQECLDPRAETLLRTFRQTLGRTPSGGTLPAGPPISSPTDQGTDALVGEQIQQ